MPAIIQPNQMQRKAVSSPDVPLRISSALIRVKVNLADAVQKCQEMTDAEIIEANALKGGLSWLDDPSEDCYDSK